MRKPRQLLHTAEPGGVVPGTPSAKCEPDAAVGRGRRQKLVRSFNFGLRDDEAVDPTFSLCRPDR